MVAKRFLSLLAILLLVVNTSTAAVPDLDTNLDFNGPSQDATVEELIAEAESLFTQQKPIQARARLMRAIEVDRKDFRPYLMLCQYYLAQVGEFTIAYRYALTAEKLFLEQHGGEDEVIDESLSKMHAAILYLRAEAELNLDRYEDSLATLDRFERRYSADWFPGTKAWVLMKLQRLDEAASVAQGGILMGADPRRTYNILGILLSMQNRREQSLVAFAKAINSELALGSRGQAATPLNNAGEVYRELFKEGLAEAAFIRAQRMSDGCEHVLPSLNLAQLYIDSLRFNAAERSLADFEACYAKNDQRLDTEHRSLIALARGRIQLRTGDIKSSDANLHKAIDRQQWFGKIGTNQDDVRLAANISIAQLYAAEAAVLKDRATASWADSVTNYFDAAVKKFESNWYFRIARNEATHEMSDFEDLYIRHTDTQLEYPTLGNAIASLPSASLQQRIDRLKVSDTRKEAKGYYDLYLAENFMNNGSPSKAVELLTKNQTELRKIDGLARAENLAKLIEANRKNLGLWARLKGNYNADIPQRLSLYRLLPSHLRYADFKLPVKRVDAAENDKQCPKIAKLLNSNFPNRFDKVDADTPLIINLTCDSSTNAAKLTLFDNDQGRFLAESTTTITGTPAEAVEFYNSFVDKAFTFKSDPPAEPLPELDFIN